MPLFSGRQPGARQAAASAPSGTRAHQEMYVAAHRKPRTIDVMTPSRWPLAGLRLTTPAGTALADPDRLAGLAAEGLHDPASSHS